MNSKPLKLVLLTLILLAAGGSCIYHFSFAPGNDSGTFSAIGYHLLEGKKLYTEAWDHKQPLIFIINQIDLATFGADYFSIRITGVLFSLLTSFLMFLLLRRIFRESVPAFFFSLYFI